MRNLKDLAFKRSTRDASPQRSATAAALVAELETNGIVVLPNLIDPIQLRSMQTAFESRLHRLRWNNFDGYQRTELYRHMVEDVLLLDQGFVDIALHPIIKTILDSYLGSKYELTEAKGWKSLPTTRDFHGWHGDAWYDQSTATDIHREVKLAFYLTDVSSGAFNYIKGSHRQQHPRLVSAKEVEQYDDSRFMELVGPAGTAFLFDTSGIHRQGLPILEPRQAVFYNYHDPNVALQEEDVNYYRYHPLLLNAAFLGDLAAHDQRILGFGNKSNFQPAFERPVRAPLVYGLLSSAFGVQLRARDLRLRVTAKLRRVLGS